MKINVLHVAKLANLPLKNEEIKKLEEQLSETLTYIEKLNSINTENIEPTSQVTGLENVAREDEPKPSLSQEEALSNTKSQHNGLFKIKAVFDV
ncbi:MAG: Asp-tRNA(Asn)/Glu-tRNA(Gln) amidotransferase subunit GatC [Candidatus Levybacteria bacterium]|nr:Asp-tRNA(Asn)/Glu-tRNA(Gln) amidotransferase subunit GatC [Candidatus Levybacteria bacterium]